MGDIFSEPYYVKLLNDPTLYLIKQDEFEADVKSFAEGLKVDINKYAIDNFKPSKIVYPKSQSQY
jgi:hypothetical protein